MAAWHFYFLGPAFPVAINILMSSAGPPGASPDGQGARNQGHGLAEAPTLASPPPKGDAIPCGSKDLDVQTLSDGDGSAHGGVQASEGVHDSHCRR